MIQIRETPLTCLKSLNDGNMFSLTSRSVSLFWCPEFFPPGSASSSSAASAHLTMGFCCREIQLNRKRLYCPAEWKLVFIPPKRNNLKAKRVEQMWFKKKEETCLISPSVFFINLQVMVTPLLCPTLGKPSPSSMLWSASPSPCWCSPPASRGSCTRWSSLPSASCTARGWSLVRPPSSTLCCWWFWCCCSSLLRRRPCSARWRCPGRSWMGSTSVSSRCAPSDWGILFRGRSLGRRTGRCTRWPSWVSAAVYCVPHLFCILISKKLQ